MVCSVLISLLLIKTFVRCLINSINQESDEESSISRDRYQFSQVVSYNTAIRNTHANKAFSLELEELVLPSYEETVNKENA